MADVVTERFSVHGMSCAACVGKVEKSLMSMSGMHTVSVSLLTESAVVEFAKSAIDVKTVLKKIESLGYTASHLEQREAGRLRLHIDAMTSRNVAQVEEALKASAGVHSVELTLLTSSALVLFDPTRTGARFLLECLARIGLSATLQQLDGTNELQKNQVRELRNWKNRLLVSAVFTVPAFIVCMILPMLPQLEKQMMQKVGGYVDLSAIICGILAFPVQVRLPSAVQRLSLRLRPHARGAPHAGGLEACMCSARLRMLASAQLWLRPYVF